MHQSSKYLRYSFILILLFLVSFFYQYDVGADVGVPPAQPGSSLSPGDFETNVQMVSEVVEITILKEPAEAVITAEFQMRNNGVEDEEFEVWFPYGEKFPNSKGIKIIQAKDFRAWVDGEEVEITIEKSDEWNLIWVHWKTYFPAQTPLTISVSYRLLPDGHIPPYYNFAYILETGAGWQGVIERAEIKVNMPYSLQELDNLLGIGDVLFAHPEGYLVNPDGIEWVFENLEPTESDNIEIKPLKPDTWFNIHDAIIKLDTTPDDWAAHVDLASGLRGWMWFREWAESEGLVDTFDEMDRIIDLISQSHLKILELSPLDERRYVSAILFFEQYPELIGGSQLQVMLDEAKGLYPDNQQLVRVYERAQEEGVFDIEKSVQDPTPTAASSVTPAALPTEAPVFEEPAAIPLNLIMGLIFIGAAGLLLVIAIRRRSK